MKRAEVVQRLGLGSWTCGLAFDSKRRYLYVGENDPGTNDTGSLVVVDSVTAEVVARIPLNGEPGTESIALDPYEQFVYLPTRNLGTETLYKIRTSDYKVEATLPLPGIGNPGISLSPDGKVAYVPHTGANLVYKVNTTTMSIVGHWPIDSPGSFIVSPDGTHAIVTSQTSPKIQVFDLVLGKVVQTIELGDLGYYDGHKTSWYWDAKKARVYIPIAARDGGVAVLSAAGLPGDLKGRIAFVSPSEQKIYVMNADGSSRQQVPLPPLDIVHAPQWSRDGLWLTFSGGPGLNSQIYIVRPDGSGFRRVTNGSGDMVEPSFSPDGSQIAFCGSDGTALYIINTDGTGLRRLPVDGSFPEWWPLGDKILYSNWGRTYESDLFLYDCAAGQSIQITHHTPGQAFIRAAWSPNGRRLAVDFRDRNRTGGKRDVLIMNADGSNPYNFTAAWPDSDEGAACWSPDGQFILFASDRTGNFDIWYSPVDVFSPVNVTNSPEDEDMPAMGTIPEAQPVYHVDAVNGNDNNNGLSRRTAFATIAKGIDSATNRYKVLVYPGVYQEEVDFKGKAITIQGVATKTGMPIIENPGDFAVSFYNGEGPRSILKNFGIKNSFMAIFIAGSSPTLKNLNIIGNKYGVEAYAGSEPDVSNCIFWENSDSDLFGCEARYSCTSEPGQGNIAADPCFVDLNNGDYHLLSERGRYWPRADVWVLDKVTSPCIDGGDPDDDVLDEPMPNGGRIDMGSFGGTLFASMSEIKWLNGDINHDGRVNLADLAMLTENWLSEDSP